jgi:threonine dehydrogenase-like Zn-dependent dehydrogenase
LVPGERGQLLVRTSFVSICGSDIPYFAGSRRAISYPLPAGARAHECVGQVVESTSDCCHAGDRVVAIPEADLGLAEFFVAHDTDAVRLPDDLAGLETSTLIQPLATVMSAVDRLGSVESRPVAVVGLGSMGLLFCWLLRRRGARPIVGIDPCTFRSDLALRFGADETFPLRGIDVVQAARQHSSSWDPPEVCIEAVGHQTQTLNDCIELVRREGTVLAFGVPDQPVYALEFEVFFRKNAALVACVTPSWATYLPLARDLFASCREELKALCTHRFPIRQAAEAFSAYERADPGLVKVLLDASQW